MSNRSRRLSFAVVRASALIFIAAFAVVFTTVGSRAARYSGVDSVKEVFGTQKAGLETADDPSRPVGFTIVINEVDSDTAGTDAAEFVEFYIGQPNVFLNGYVLVFYNGDTDTSYLAISLTGSTNASGHYTVGNAAVPGVDQIFADNTLQNGPDAVALYFGDATSFPNGTPVTTTNLVDAVVYNTGNTTDPGYRYC
ncbi:MAG: hypothetical protein WKF34_11355 [Pyrinomonadaceae bacterium]